MQLIRLETNSGREQRFGDVRTDQVFAEALEEYRRKKNHRAPLTNATVDNSNVLPPQFGLDKFVYEHRVQRKGGSKREKRHREWFRNRAKEKEIEKRKRARERKTTGGPSYNRNEGEAKRAIIKG